MCFQIGWKITHEPVDIREAAIGKKALNHEPMSKIIDLVVLNDFIGRDEE
jgi:hypothetical protein